MDAAMNDGAGRTDSPIKMYRELAWVFPLVSPAEHYLEEAERIRRLILREAAIPVRRLLDLGCGAGNIDSHLKADFDITAVDCSAAMMDLARSLNPEVKHHQSDMRTLRLNEEFDAVICLDAILYMNTTADLQAALQTAYTHLEPGGVFITYPQETRESFQQNRTRIQHHAHGETEITFFENLYDPDPSDTEYDANYVYFIRHTGSQEVHHDLHHMGLFSTDTWLRLFRETGFDVQQLSLEPDAPASGLPDPVFVAVRR